MVVVGGVVVVVGGVVVVVGGFCLWWLLVVWCCLLVLVVVCGVCTFGWLWCYGLLVLLYAFVFFKDLLILLLLFL